MTEPETTCKGFEVNHLVKQYANADKPVLDDISFKVEHGSVLVVLGPSGSGKSTLLRTIAGLEPIQGGTISINDQVIDAGKPGTERAGRSDRSSELRTRIGMGVPKLRFVPEQNGARQHHHGAGARAETR